MYYPKILLCHCSKNVLRVLLQCTLNFPALTAQVKTGIIPAVNDNEGVVPLWHRMGEPTSVFEGARIAFPVQESSVVEEAGKGAESTHLLWVGSQRSHREAIFCPYFWHGRNACLAYMLVHAAAEWQMNTNHRWPVSHVTDGSSFEVGTHKTAGQIFLSFDKRTIFRLRRRNLNYLFKQERSSTTSCLKQSAGVTKKPQVQNLGQTHKNM